MRPHSLFLYCCSPFDILFTPRLSLSLPSCEKKRTQSITKFSLWAQVSGYQRESRWFELLLFLLWAAKPCIFIKYPLLFLSRPKTSSELRGMMAAAKDMDDGEFWLPSDFLSDDFFAGEEKLNETESDEEDPVSGLSRQMTSHSFFNVENKSNNNYYSAFNGENPKPSVMATSPQSTLCGIGSWSFSSSGSPDGPSKLSSPPSTPFQQPGDDALDLLYAAAGQVERLGPNIDTTAARGLLGPPQEHSYQIPATKNQKMGFYSSQDLIQQQLQAARFYQLKRQQLLKQQQQFAAAWWQQQQQSKARSGARPLGLSSSAWPPLQKQQKQQQPSAGSGMTAVFLNGRRQSNGTGVFLPRRVGTPNEPKRKQGCSTVLLPARVVQALNLNLEDMAVHPRLPGCYVLDNESAMARSNLKRNRPAAAPPTSPEIRLPQEWTY